jgi:hypothetical protein
MINSIRRLLKHHNDLPRPLQDTRVSKPGPRRNHRFSSVRRLLTALVLRMEPALTQRPTATELPELAALPLATLHPSATTPAQAQIGQEMRNGEPTFGAAAALFSFAALQIQQRATDAVISIPMFLVPAPRPGVADCLWTKMEWLFTTPQTLIPFPI